ncbi:DUF2783 domain-containing protein [Piscinibacter sp.]|jgi:hypothetical protein|uniref:DUF2783 domain-containing protein n=1 Tax=Piscinibacter sp. TaxID=1903157 RepID=UPI003559DED1
MPLILTPHITDPDGFYEELIASQRDLSDEQADMLTTKLVLILANHVGEREVLREAIALARSNTLAGGRAAAPR